MSILDAGKACIASAIKITITQNGVPIQNAEITRSVDWDNVGEKDDATVTNSAGEFELPALYMRSIIRSILPLEFVASTLVQVHVDNESHRLFYAIKRSEEPNVEFGGEPAVLRCELSDDESLIRFGGTLIKTRCSWNK
ncbi:DUF6795 domain-containing protein [Parendozoicomonas sp. Alg238-R29]|uniref:DUF6795 domain-containing protein n=1 Tax=Parendozoicomonas sp. Alg238-R29 TaxID=2993446 RepID=UPI00248E00A8|nr:DUF6795 domain-containing protein [Parendozoicomonas sp. Alg238-R29]